MMNKLPSIKPDHIPNDINIYHRGGLSHLTDYTEKDNNLRSSTISEQGVNANHAYYPTRNSYLRPHSTFDQVGHPPRERDFGNNLNYSSSMVSSPGEKPSVPSEYSTLYNHSSFVSSNANSRRISTPIDYDSYPCKINYDEEYAHNISPVDKCPSIRTDQSSNHSNIYHCGSLPQLTDYCEKNNNSISSTISQQGVNTDHAYYPARNCYPRPYSTFDQWGHPPREKDFGNTLSYLSSMADHPREVPSVSSEYSTPYNHSNFVSSDANSRNFPTPITNYESPPCMINNDERFINRTSVIGSLSSPIDKNKSSPLYQAKKNNCSRPDILNGAQTRGILGGKLIYSFPEKLFQLLDDTYKEGKSDIVSFLPDGHAFVLYKKQKFMTDIVPKYFRFSKLTSFQRQLSMYGFRRINSGKDAGAYYHKKFLREKPSFCTQIKRINSKEGNSKLDLDTTRNTINIHDTAVADLEAT